MQVRFLGREMTRDRDREDRLSFGEFGVAEVVAVDLVAEVGEAADGGGEGVAVLASELGNYAQVGDGCEVTCRWFEGGRPS